ncbi:MAG: hypothetical protein HYR73_09760, partial [Candidatus Eisenbacteria bacterium]|nr:hypothetical protein [Candidatus Eisenbacteria bacterium]
MLLIVATVGISSSSLAQYSAFALGARQSAGFALDPLGRSPGLAGMGRLTVVGEDPHYRITLWDLAGNPTGVLGADSASTLDVRPGAIGASDVSNPNGSSLERETFSARGSELGFEAWRRQRRIAYGAIGTFGHLNV